MIARRLMFRVLSGVRDGHIDVPHGPGLLGGAG